MIENITGLIQQYAENPLELLKALNGFYECQKDAHGNRITPLIGYAGKYPADEGKELQYVGEVYANFSKAEEYPSVMSHFAEKLWTKIELYFRYTQPKTLLRVVFIGPQMGGVSIAQWTAFHGRYSNSRYACAEKKITAVATKELREQSELFFGRHEVRTGDFVIICEDVMNNFSTTKEVIDLIHFQGAELIAIAGLLNRSMTVTDTFEYKGQIIPVIPLVHKPFDQYKQDDPYVVEDMEKGNVVLKPKAEWSKLQQKL